MTTTSSPSGTSNSNGTSPAGTRPNQRPPHKPRHRVLTLIIVVLLIAVPGGYLVRSAFQSRDSGQDKQRKAAATNLTYGWPSKAQRSIYDVPLPSQSSHYAYYEANSWQTSTLYVQFRTSKEHLGDFLEDSGVERTALRDDKVTIKRSYAGDVGWNFNKEGHHYAGATFQHRKDGPKVSITVDRTYESRPRVYVVSHVKV